MAAGIPLGPFDLREPIGRGGMGEVWAAVHRESGLRSAVKVLTGAGATDPSFLAAFHHEARAVAALDHPNIVPLLEYGLVDERTARRSKGRLVAGTPFLVMEMVDGGTLAPWRGRLAWPDLRAVLLGILDALAHAHARGVIHRDVKPGNVLLGQRAADGRFGAVKVGDFGIAHVVGRDGAATVPRAASGTPAYMAPEQLENRWRDYGPWTDLYALGVLIYELAAGRPPFGRRKEAVAAWRKSTAPPPLEARISTPPAFEDFVLRLLERDPHRRFRRAADAAWALHELGDAPSSEPLAAAPERIVHDAARTTLLWMKTEVPTATVTPAPPSVEEGDAPLPTPPPLPGDWRRPDLPPPRLVGVGLGLFGLRTVPLVDRERERDLLWSELARVRADGRAGVVVLRGSAGCGKSRIVEWMCERAHEVGSAIVLTAVHGPVTGPADGIGPMVARHLRTVGMPPGEAAARVEALLRRQGAEREAEWQALTDLVAPDPHRASTARSPAERHGPVRRLLERVARERPVVLWLDDVQWGFEALSFTNHLLQRQDESPSPVLVLMTAREEALAERPAEEHLLDGVLEAAGDRGTTLRIGPLEPEHRRTLIRDLLGLEGDLATRVEERTGGNPLLAVQLVGDWVQRGLLEPGRRGFVLKRGERPQIPDDLHQVWGSRVERVLAGRPAEDRVAIEVAAVLGQDVDGGEWEDACAEAGVAPCLAVLERMLRERLANPVEGADGGFAFGQAMLRESLERSAREAGRFEAIHLACAAMLRRRDGAEVQARLGLHLVAAGRLEESLEPLLRGANERRNRFEGRYVEALLAERDRAMDALGLAPDDRRRVEGWALRSRLDCDAARYDAAEVNARRAEAIARRNGWRPLLFRALRDGADVARHVGASQRALDRLREATAIGREEGDPRMLGEALLGLGEALRMTGAAGEARAAYEEALGRFEATGDPELQGYCWDGLASVAYAAGRFDDCRDHLERGRVCLERAGSRIRLAVNRNLRGELARRLGDLPLAEACYRESLALFDAVGVAARIVPQANLALVELEQGRVDAARAGLEKLLALVRKQGRKPLVGIIHTTLLPCRAAAGDWGAWDADLAAAIEIVAETGVSEVDMARMAVRAAVLAEERGEGARARDAYALALLQWRALGARDEAERVAAEIERLRAGVR